MRKKINFNLVCFILICIFLIPIILLAFYNHPNFDDYAYSINTYQCIKNGCGTFNLIKEAFKTSYDFMYTWQGLYSSAFLLSLQPAIFGEKFYSTTTFFLLISIFIGIYIFINTIYKYILKKDKSLKFKLFISFILEFFLIETAPSGREALYWFNGAVNYAFFWSLLLIVFSGYLAYFCFNKKKPILLILLSFASFSLSGGNHVTAFAGIIIGTVFCILSFIKKKQRLLTIPLLFEILGFLINISSPGTKVRAAALAQCKQGVFNTIYTTFLKSFELFSEWISISLILMIVLLICLIWDDIKDLKFNYSKHLLLIPFISYLLIAAMMCVPYYVLGGYGAGRVLNVLYFTFAVLLIFNILLLIKYLKDKKIIKIKKFDKLKVGIISIVCIIFIGIIGNNFYFFSTSLEAFNEIRTGTAKKFSDQSYDRIRLLENKSLDKVIVKPYEAKPELLYGIDLCEITDENSCENSAINQYYNKKVVGIKQE